MMFRSLGTTITVTLVIAAAVPASASEAALYGEATNYQVTQCGVSPTAEAIAPGDFNRDGRPDAAMTDECAGGVFVMYGNGDGSLQQPRRFATGMGADAVSAGDLDGDRNLDLVVSNGLAGTVSVLLGDGKGDFVKAADYPTGSAPGAIAIADFNGDRWMDFAVAANPSYLFLGTGGSQFTSRNLGVGASVVGLAADDFGADGALDLVVGDGWPAKLHVLRGRGDGTFGQPQPYVVPGWVLEAFRVDDVNGDRWPDVVGVNSEGRGSVWLGQADGTLAAPTAFNSGTGSAGVAIADLNGDQKPDLAINETESSLLAIHLGDGTGGFTKVETHPVVRSAESIGVVDLNRDRLPDLVVAPFFGPNISVLIHEPGAKGRGGRAADRGAPPAKAEVSGPRVEQATVDGMDINVVLPEGYAGSHRRYPVLYLLHPFNEDREAWLAHSDLLELTSGQDVIVVLPSAGNTAGVIADARDGSCRGETQVMRGVIPYVDARYRTVPGRAGRAIAGASSGGFNAMHLAARNADEFVAAASLSGPPDVTLGMSPVGEIYFFSADRDAVFECGGNPVTGGLFGTPVVDEVWVRGANPADLAPNFRGMSVYTGDGNGVPCDPDDYPEFYRGGFTPITRQSSESFIGALDRAGVPNTADLRDCGFHSWRYFQQFLHAFLPQMTAAFGTATPTTFDYRRVDADFTVWGWSFHADPARAAEFLDVQDASRSGVTLTGSGAQTVTTAGYFQPGKVVRVDDGLSSYDVVADAVGRITVTVDLGPPHQTQQYQNPLEEHAPGYFTTRTVQFVQASPLL